MKERCRRIVRSTLLDAETLLHEPENPPARAVPGARVPAGTARAAPKSVRCLASLIRVRRNAGPRGLQACAVRAGRTDRTDGAVACGEQPRLLSRPVPFGPAGPTDPI